MKRPAPASSRPASHPGAGVTVLEFYADWCSQSAVQQRIIRDLAPALGDVVTFQRIDVETDGDLADAHAIDNVPTVIILKEGKEYGRFVGIHSAASLLGLLKQL